MVAISAVQENALKENSMSKMERKTKMMIAAAMLLISGFVYSQTAGQTGQQAQQPGTASQASPSNEVQNALKQIGTALNLTEDQKGKIKPILESELSQLVGLRNDTS